MTLAGRRNRIGAGLLVLGVLLLVVPVLVPVEPALIHDTDPGSFESPEQLEQRGIEVIAYENLSERGQEIYRNALATSGVHRVSPGQGAPEFSYPTRGQLASGDERAVSGLVAIERPEDSTLPPADEPRGRIRGEEGQQSDERAQQYELMETREGPPPLGSLSQLLRLLAGVLGVVSVGVGGYLFASLDARRE
jgi:hypothetical protein